MARPERNNVDYFPHEVINGKKMHYIECKYKNDGYAVWFKLLEQLGKADYHYLNISDDIQMMYLSSSFNVSESLLRSIIEDLVKLKVFNKELYESGVLYSQKFVDSIKDAYLKRNNKLLTLHGLGVYLLSLGVLKPSNGILKVSDNPQRIGKDIKEENTKVNGVEKFIKEKKENFEKLNSEIKIKLEKYSITEPVIFSGKKIPVQYLDLSEFVLQSLDNDEWKINLKNRFGGLKFDRALQNFIKSIKTDYSYMDYNSLHDFQKHFSNWLNKVKEKY